MIAFVLSALMLVGGTLAMLLAPLRRKAAPRAAAQDAANLAFYRGEDAALTAERAAGHISEVQYQQERTELERRLLADVDPPPHRKPQVHSRAAARRSAIGVGLAVPLLAVLVYVAVGNLRAINPPPAVRQAAHPIAARQIESMVERLAERLERSPHDVAGWTMLARSLAALGRYEESAHAFAKLSQLVPANANVLADYADTLAMARGHRLDGAPFDLVKRALAVEPTHLKALALAGSAEFERGRYRAAIGYWERMLKVIPPQSDFARSVQGSIAEARRRVASR